MCVLFSLQLLFKIFLILRRNEQMYNGLHKKYTLYLSDYS
jgi:hypothetical protein